jgi:regulator of protease activity HflC (stomatin/prohibitin superfamily)
MELAGLIVAAVAVILAFILVSKTVRIVPQARARNVERFGRYRKTLEPGMNFIVPLVDRVKPLIDLREQVVSFRGQPVITEDNLVVSIDTVLFFQVTDPRAADYEIVNYIQAIEQITATMLRSVIGSMDLEQTLTSRDKINARLRGVLDDASGKWGIRVTRVEIKAIDPPKSVIDAMEKQMRAEREKRAVILTSEGQRDAAINNAEGEKQQVIKASEATRQQQMNEAEGQAAAILAVADATAQGIRKVADAIQLPGGYEAVQLRVAEQYIGQFGNIARAGTTMVLPANAADVGSMIALAMNVIGRGKPETAAR